MPEAQLSPREYENHVIHWREHTRVLQEYSFKFQTPVEAQDRLINHIRATEMLMVEQAASNPLFAQELQKLALFPMFFKAVPPPPSMAETAPMASMPASASAGLNAPIMEMPGMPVNAALGGEPQQLNQEPVPSLEDQAMAGGPVQPTSQA